MTTTWTCHYCGAEHVRPSSKVDRACALCGQTFTVYVTKQYAYCPDCRGKVAASKAEERH